MTRFNGRDRGEQREGERGVVMVEEAPAMSMVAVALLEALRFLPPSRLRLRRPAPLLGGKRAEVPHVSR